MKILTKEGMYIQKNDMAYLARLEIELSESLTSIFFQGSCTNIDDSNRYEFIKIVNKGDIEFLNSQDWIVDYNCVKDLNQDQLQDMFNELADRRCVLADKFNAMSTDERMRHVEIIDECENLRYKMISINDINLYKHGRLSMNLPRGFEMKIKGVNEKKANGFQKIIKRVFGKKLD